MKQINVEFDKIYADNRNVATVLTNHTKILKMILDSSSINHEELLKDRMEEHDLATEMSRKSNSSMQGNFINDKLIIAAIMIDETSEDINTAINAINDGKQGIVHQQILTPIILKNTIQEFENTKRTRFHFNNDESNYQHIIDISQLSVALIKGLFTYILEITIIEQEEGQVQRIIPIPYPIKNVYFSIIPNYDYVIKYRDSYVPTDKDTIDKCKNIIEYKICERSQPATKLSESETCESTLFERYSEAKCKTSPFLLHRETFIPIANGYIIIPANPTNLDISCESTLRNLIINQPTIIQGKDCKIYNDLDVLYLKNFQRIESIEQFNVTYNTKYLEQDLNNLKEQLIQLPKVISNNELRQARLSLDDSENMLANIAQHRRAKTITETALTYLSYLGYGALITGLLYLFYKIGFFKCLIDCIPKKICLFCVKTKIESPTHVVAYNASAQPLIPEFPKNKRVKI